MTGPGRERTRRAALGLAGALLAAPAVRAQGIWNPTRPITLTVGFPPGGRSDAVARYLQAGLGAALGVPIDIDNRPGAAGNAGTEAVMAARPDGTTLLVGGTGPLAINPHIIDGMSVDPREMAPIGLASQTPLVLCAGSGSPLGDLAALRRFLAGSAPGGVEYASSGAGSLPHLAMELLRARLGAPEMTHVPARSASAALKEVQAGKVTLAFANTGTVLRPLAAQQLRGIFVTGRERSPSLPATPTAAQQGLADFVFSAWLGLFAPRGTPGEIVTRLNQALNSALARPDLRTAATTHGEELGGGPPSTLAELLARDYERWGGVARANNIRAET